MAVQIIGFINEADKSLGLKAGDIITAVNGKQVEESAELEEQLRRDKPTRSIEPS